MRTVSSHLTHRLNFSSLCNINNLLAEGRELVSNLLRL
jgi:hypothetical protein